MHINTRPVSLLGKKQKHSSLFNSTIRLTYSSATPGETPEMEKIRLHILKGIDKNKNVDDLIEQFNELKEAAFVQQNGMSSDEFEQKKEEEYRNIKTESRNCLCYDCKKTHNTDRLHPVCPHCGNKRDDFSEQVKDSNSIGKTIDSYYRGDESDFILFDDGSYMKIYNGLSH